MFQDRNLEIKTGVIIFCFLRRSLEAPYISFGEEKLDPSIFDVVRFEILEGRLEGTA